MNTAPRTLPTRIPSPDLALTAFELACQSNETSARLANVVAVARRHRSTMALVIPGSTPCTDDPFATMTNGGGEAESFECNEITNRRCPWNFNVPWNKPLAKCAAIVTVGVEVRRAS